MHENICSNLMDNNWITKPFLFFSHLNLSENSSGKQAPGLIEWYILQNNQQFLKIER